MEVERTNNLNNIQKILQRLLKKGNTAVGTQTDPVEGLEEINFKVMLHGEEEEPSEGTDPDAGDFT